MNGTRAPSNSRSRITSFWDMVPASSCRNTPTARKTFLLTRLVLNHLRESTREQDYLGYQPPYWKPSVRVLHPYCVLILMVITSNPERRGICLVRPLILCWARFPLPWKNAEREDLCSTWNESHGYAENLWHFTVCSSLRFLPQDPDAS